MIVRLCETERPETQVEQLSTSRLANAVAASICRAFHRFQNEFLLITQRAKDRFAETDWQGLHADSRARLDVYESTVQEVVADIRELSQGRLQSRLVWVSVKAVYSGLIMDRHDWEIAETFYNSVTRRIFTTVGVDEEIEFVHTDYRSPPTRPLAANHATYAGSQPLDEVILQLILDHDLPLMPNAARHEAALAAREIKSRLSTLGMSDQIESLDMIRSVFYRGEHAHLVGRITIAGKYVPLVLSFRGTAMGAVLAAIIVDRDDMSLLFSYTRSYFHVETERPYELVKFIKTVLPNKPTAEIYIAIGYNKHGKTELYRHALRHLAAAHDKYQLAPGHKGMVMIVFTMPSYPVVFKVIRDQFDYPKETTRQAVIGCYRLVFNHDRAGRLIDAQEYQCLTLERARFDNELVDELLQKAGETVTVEGNFVVIKHCYAERRVTPLDIYLREQKEDLARKVVVDYGQAIRDLAVTNIFPGDLLLKNFGVTRQGRVVFYDYDEVCHLTDCRFRRLPETDDYDDSMAAEPWYGVARNDVFPEEFRYFLGLSDTLRQEFMKHHSELLTVDYWTGIQEQLRQGMLFHVLPYSKDNRVQREL